MIDEDINERMARLAPSQNIAGQQLQPAAIDAIAALPQESEVEPDQYGLNPTQQAMIGALPVPGDIATKSSLMAARDINPDQAARARRAGAKTGVGADIAMRNLTEVERRAFMQDVDRMQIAQRDPALAQFLQNRDNAMVAHDDIEALHQTQGLFGDLGMTAVGIGSDIYQAITEGTAPQGVRMAPQAFEAGVQMDAAAREAARLRRLGRPTEQDRQRVAAMRQAAGELMEEAGGGIVTGGAMLSGQMKEPLSISVYRGAQTALVFGGTAAAAAPFTGGASMAAVKPAMGIGFTAGFTASMVQDSYENIAGIAYMDMLDKGITEENAQFYSGVAGIAGASLEMAGQIPFFGQGIKAAGLAVGRRVADRVIGRGAVRAAGTAVKDAGLSMASEGLTEGSQVVTDAVALHMAQRAEGKKGVLDTPEGRQKVIDDAVDEALMVAEGMTLLSLPFPLLNFAGDLGRIRRSQQRVARLQRAINAVSNSKTAQRDPDAVKELIDARTEGNPDTDLYIDGAQMDVILRQSEIDPRSLDGLMPGFSERLAEAVATGGDIRMTQGEFLPKLALTETGKAMTPYLRVGDPADLNMLQQAMVAQESAANLEAIRAEGERAGGKAKEFVDSVNRVEDEIIAGLEATGQFKPDEIRMFAMIQTSVVANLAPQLNMTPEEFWAKHRNQVVGYRMAQPAIDQPAQFNQQGQRRTDTPEFNAWFVDSKAVDQAGMPLMLYHGTEAAEDFAVFEPGGGFFARGIYLSPRPQIAGEYAGTGTGARIMPLYASIQNPFVVEADTSFEQAVSRETGVAVTEETSPDTITELLRSKGYDGVYVRADDVWVAFDPQQVKSVNNRGTWTGEAMLAQQPVSPTAELESVANVEAAFAFAGTQTFKTNRQFKEALQARVTEAAARNGIDLSAASPEVDEYLVRVAVADAITALQTNPNAVGWYNEKVTKALRLVSLIHPEIATDSRAKFAFTWALAVTSNGLKVKKNFELAERVYSQYKATGRMPTNVQAGQAQIAINESLALFNDLVDKYGIDNVERFMTSKTTVKQVIEYTGKNVSGENLTTEVYGAAALGPKIGNGFFANLYGHFEQLTMDRWLMRTWGRWTASLLDDNTQNIAAKRSQLTAIVKAMGAKARRDLSAIAGIDANTADPDALAAAINKASMSKDNRLAMAKVGIADDKAQAKLSKILGNPVRGTVRVSFGDEFRKVGNALAKYLDGQKEAPSGPPERARIRGVMSRALAQLQTQYPSLTMSDLQALLWYPEKRLYDAAKTSDEGKTGYEDNEAPDYANAAADLAAEMGVAQDLIQATIKDVDEELKAIADERAATAQRGAGDSVLRQAPVAQAGVFEQAQVSPEFYSALERGIGEIDAKELTGAQWKERVAALVNKGIVKQAEVEWSFLNEWLSLPREGKISKAQVRDYLKNKGVRINVITYGGGDPTLAGVRLAEQALERAGALNDDAISAIERIRTAKPEGQLYRQSWELLDELLGAAGIPDSLMDLVDAAAPHFDEYVEADGRNYREELLQLPDTEAQNQRLNLRNQLATQFGFLVNTPISQYPQDNPLVQQLKQIESTMTKRDLARFTMGHYGEPNVLVHIRRDDRTDSAGVLTMNVTELQSDWAQKGRELGFADAEQERTLAFWKGEVSRLTTLRDEYEASDDARRRIAAAIDSVNELYADMQRTYAADQIEQMADWREDQGQLKFEPDEVLTFEQVRDVLGGIMMEMSNAGYTVEADRIDDITDTMLEGSGFSELMAELDAAIQATQSIERTGSTVMPAPFVTSTSGWVDLALKHLMMEAVKGGYGRIIFPTWQVQMLRYGSDKFSWYRMPDGTYRVASDLAWDQDAIADIDLAEAGKRAMAAKGSRVSKAEDLKRIIEPRNPQMTAKQLDSLANKMWERMQASDGVGAMLPRREGMESFYGDENMIDPKTGKLSIVGAALAKLSKKYKGPGISATEITIEEPSEGVSVVVTSPEQAERVMDWVQANVPDADDVMDYDEERMAVEVDAMTERQRRRLETSFAGEPDSPEITWVTNPVGIDERHTRSGIEITPGLTASIGTGLPLFQQPMDQPEPQGTFDIKSMMTRLNKGANVYTLIHESGHYWLEVMGRISAGPDAPARIAADFDRILQWFGIAGADARERAANWNAMDLEQKRPHHEAWARNIELYMAEGKAPSLELQPAFERFMQWMKRFYVSMRDQFNEQYKREFGKDMPIMSAPVREVMERLLASDEQIERAKAVRNAMALFDVRPEGLTDAEWQALQDMQLDADIESLAAMRAEVMKSMKWLRRAERGVIRDMQKESDERRAEVRAEVAEAVAQEPVYRARTFLSRGTYVDADGNPQVAANHRLDIDAVRQMYELEPENLRPDLSKLGTGAYGMMGKGGMNPEVAAEMFGYSSADAMIRDLIEAPSLDEAIEAQTDRRMLAENGEMNTPAQREEAVDRALHGELRARLIATQLRLVAKAMQPVRVIQAAAKEVARQVIGGKALRDIRVREYVAAESRAAKDAQEAYRGMPDPKRAGDAAYTRSINEQMSAVAAGMPISDAEAIAEQARQAAVDRANARRDEYRAKYPSNDPDAVLIAAKRNELLNHELAREALAARDEVDKAIVKFRRLFRADADIAKTRNMDKVMAARAILAAFGLGRSDKPIMAYMEQIQKYDPDMYAELVPIIGMATRGAMDYRDMTLNDFRTMRDAVEALWFNAKRDQEIVIEGKAMALESAVSELNGRLDELGAPRAGVGVTHAVTWGQKRWKELLQLKSMITTVESWAQRMDALNPRGPFTRYIWRPIKGSIGDYLVDKKKYIGKYEDALKKLALPVQRIHSDELGYTFGAGNGGLGKAEVLGAMMHMGNESNLRKLLLGRGWGELDADGNLDTSRWDAFVQRMFAEGVITKADMDFLQEVWDLNEEIKPLAQRAHRQIFGYYFKEVEASPVQTPFGTYRGGYVPAKADTELVPEASIRAQTEQLESDFRNAMPSTGFGFTFSRVDYNVPLSLDARMIMGHVDSVLRFAHIQPALKDVLKVINNREFKSAMNGFDESAIKDMLLPWLNRAARQNATESIGWAPADRAFRGLRSRTGVAIMMGNIKNTLENLTGLSIGLYKIDPGSARRSAGFARGALKQYLASPMSVTQAIADASPFMDERMRSQIFEMQNSVNEVLRKPTLYNTMTKFFAKHAYFMQTATQNVVDAILWTATYNRAMTDAMAGGMDPEAAHNESVLQADSVIRLTQSSMRPEDMAAFEAGSPFYQSFTQFMSWSNRQANLQMTEWTVIMRDLGWRSNKGRMFMLYLLTYAIPSIMTAIIAKTVMGRWDDEDDDGHLDTVLEVLLGSQMRMGVGMIPGGAYAYPMITGGFTDTIYDDKVMSSPAMSTLTTAFVGTGKLATQIWYEDKEVNTKNVKDALTLINLLFGLPVDVPGRSIIYAIEVNQGKIEPTGTIDYLRGLATGRASAGTRQ